MEARVFMMTLKPGFFYPVFAILFCSQLTEVYAQPITARADKPTTNVTAVSRFDNRIDAKTVLLKPNVSPSDLYAGKGSQVVRFSAPLLGKVAPGTKVYLRRRGDKQETAMKEIPGKEVDKVRIWVADVPIDTDKAKPDSCLQYEAFIKGERANLVSPPVQLCLSSFPVGFSESNVTNPAVFPDGSKAVADEILLTVSPSMTSEAIRQIATGISAKVVGGYKSMNLYQLRFSMPFSVGKLIETVSKLKGQPGVVNASINAIGSFAYTPNDTAFNLLPTDANGQHDLKLVLEHNEGTGANAWDANARGSGVTVVVMDSGLDLTHPDLDATWTCQTSASATLVPCTDPVGHGTQVAGTVAAKTNNGLGVAGAAFDSRIHSIQVSTNANVTAAQMITGFQAARDYAALHPEASVFNASFYAAGGSGTAADWASVCTAIEQTVFNGVARAVVVNAVGNNNLNGVVYPARCKDMNVELNHKDLLITVSNSTSTVADASCGSLPVDQRCSTSNFGAWVDIAAPGSLTRTTTTGGGYTSQTGNSFSAPLVAGAAAMLRSCSTPLPPAQIKSTLVSSANVSVSYPAFGANPAGTTPRLDIHRALSYRAPTAIGPLISSINENNAAGATVASLTVTDPDICDTFTFALVAGAGSTDNGSFSIAGNQLKINGVADFETQPGYSIRVRATDFGGLAFDQILTVNIINLNEPPTAVNLSNTVPSTPENGGSVKVADISVVDDALGTNTLYLSGPDWASFSIVGNALYFNGGADFETKSTYNVTVNVDDLSVGATPDASHGFVLSITNVNEAPVANNDMLTATQNTPVTYTAAQLLGNDTDVDAGTTLVIASGSVTSGTGGTAVLNGDGTVTFTPNPGFTGAATFTYRATDGSLPSNVATVTVNVAAVPHAPVANNDTLSATEDTPVTYTAAQLLGNDTDADAGTTLAIYDVANGTGGTVALNGDGTVSFNPGTNFNGAATFTYRATDGGLNSNWATVTVNVAPVNDPATGIPVILPPAANGTRTVGQTITADTSTIADVDGLGAFHYQWKRDGGNVGMDTASYTLVTADVGGFMSLCVSFTDGGGTLETVCSANDAVAVGDPHITTVDGLYYDFQSAGEFVALRDASGLEIQVRQTPVSAATPLTDANSGLTSGVSVNTGLAARVGKHRVTYQADPIGNAAPVLRVDGVVTSLQAGGIDFGDGGRVTPQGNGIQIDFPDQTSLIASASQWAPYNVWWLQLSVFHTSAYEGLMGARLKGSWLPKLSDGSALGARPAAMHDRYVDLYVKFADSWRVTGKTTLFDYAEGTSTATFTNKAWPTENGPFVAGAGPIAKPLARKAALQACRDVVGKNENAGCVFDVMVMGNKGIANAHLLNQNVRLGATQVIVRGAGRPDARGDMVFTATVARQATVLPQVRNIRAVPAGAVQFMINGEKAGAPVKLDEKGQARWKVPYQRFYKQQVSARYIPAKGSIFLPSSRLVRNDLVLEKR